MKFHEISDSNILGRDISFYNREADRYQRQNQETGAHLNDQGGISIQAQARPSDQPKYNTTPKSGEPSSPGFRGINYMRALAGLPHDSVVARANDMVGLPPDLTNPLR